MKFSDFFGTQTVRQASFILLLVGVLAKFAGFFRETLIAHEFGISADYDLFLIVFVVPAAIAITVNYTVSYALTPFYQKISFRFGSKLARNLVLRIFFFGGSFFICCSATTVMFAEYVVSICALTAVESDQQLAIQFLSILIWLLPLYFGVAVMQTILQAERFFFLSSIGPLIQNACVVLVLLIFRNAGIVSLAYAWCLGLFLWLSWLVFAVYYSQWKDECSLASIVECSPKYLLGAFFVSSVQILFIEIWSQLYVVFDRVAAQLFRLEDGSIAILGYATTLYIMVLSVFAMSIGRAIFPFLSAQVAAGDKAEQIKLLSGGIRWMVLISLPVTGGLFALSEEVVQLVYQRGNFDAAATIATAGALKIFCVGLPFESVYVILVGYFYSLRDYRGLMIVSLFSIIVKILIGVCLTDSFGHLGLAASTAGAVVCRTLFLAFRLKRYHVSFLDNSETLSLLWKSLLAILPGTLLVIYGFPLFSPFILVFNEIPAFSNIIIILVGFFVVFGTYCLVLRIFRVPEWFVFVKKMQGVVDYMKK
ncbi:MAG: polysaccharide biosynthesis C-terminal domain-containing protein [Desulfocapsa sp.]|nr:polysaccharide biosynthesis C-terminal domain-containing protein [Desulfocapsa sp.]